MLENERDWRKAIEATWIARFPKQRLATFGATNITYYVVTEPLIRDPETQESREGVIRKGRVIAERPAIITPTFLMSLQGFSKDAYEYFQDTMRSVGPNSPGIMYTYKNETDGLDIVGGSTVEIAHRISDDLDERKDDLSVVIVGVDEMWDVGLLKFIYEYTSTSMAGNVQEMQSRGLLDPQPEFGGVPRAAIQHIMQMFSDVERGAGDPEMLKRELDRWGMFQYFEDRFLGLFRAR
ncbi:MAG: hypothetical protein FJ319_10655 [SAR202 cluster bacterium]|nr:hypothetical protein [SAR202 cluster bacterium]